MSFANDENPSKYRDFIQKNKQIYTARDMRDDCASSHRVWTVTTMSNGVLRRSSCLKRQITIINVCREIYSDGKMLRRLKHTLFVYKPVQVTRTPH